MARALLLTAVLLVAPRSALTAQEPDSAALARLRAEVKAHPDSFPLVLALGHELALRASEIEKEWRARDEARRVLDRAQRLRPNDPRPYLEIGLLLRKQGMRPDAARALRRAAQRIAAGPDQSDADRGRIHLELGLIYERWWEDGENLGAIQATFERPTCSALPPVEHAAYYGGTGAGVGSFEGRSGGGSARSGLVGFNFACPGGFDQLMRGWTSLDLYQSEYATMLDEFRSALAYDPANTEAAFHLMRHLAASDAWVEFADVAESLARHRPTDPTVLLFLGLGYHRSGRPDRADSAFSAALEHASPALVNELLEPSQLLKRQDSVAFAALDDDTRLRLGDTFWRARDPLFLTTGNERLAEHLSRLAYVEVAYSSPQSGTRGRYTDRGIAWLRYGPPLHIRAVRGGDGMLEFWDYGEGPDLVFDRQRGYRYARAEENSAEYLRYARTVVPENYAPESPRIVARAPFQAAAFRGPDGDAVLEVYGALPLGTLRDRSDAPETQTGVFVVTGGHWEHRASLLGRRPTLTADTLLDATFRLPAGSYVISLEATAGEAAAQYRQRADVPSFSGLLALSDPLLVERFESEAARVDDRAALMPVVSRTRVFPRGAPIGVLWEIYGLATDSTGAAHYTVTAEVADHQQANPVLAARGGGAGGGVGGTLARWRASHVPRADRAIVEHVTIELPNVKPGSYQLFITVTDHVTGRSKTVIRGLAIQ